MGECLLFLAFFVGLCSIGLLDFYENVIQSKNSAEKYHNW